MYTEFYGLQDKPFELSPSSRFLYLGEVHREALALLTYGVVERKGFTLLTGEVGTGKTTMIHALLASLDDNTFYAHLSNPLLSPEDFMKYLAASVFKKKAQFKSKSEFLINFEGFLKKCLQHQKNFLLIIDEAHRLSFELLEEIRLLSNMETADEKLINIFLAGQPELNEKLSKPECRALLQRISTRYHIEPLDLQGTEEFILKRLKMAGAKDETKIFSKSVIKSIHHLSKGYPRMINILADNALLLGYAKGTKKILPSMVKESYEDLQLEGFLPKSPPPESQRKEISKEKNIKHINLWKWAAGLLFLIAVSVFAIILNGEQIFQRLPSFALLSQQASADIISGERLLAKEIIEQKMETAFKNNPEIEPKISVEETPDIEMDELKDNKQAKPEDPDKPSNNHSELPWETTVIVKEGETLMELAVNVYGRSDEKILNLLQKHNPEINDINFIEVGQEIVFPILPGTNQGLTFTVHIASYKPFNYARKLFLKLLKQGYEVYILPVQSSQKGKIFRITLGNFKTPQEAENYAEEIRRNNVSDYANVIQLEMR